MRYSLLALLVFISLALPAGIVSADAPTPTLKPIPPSPTSQSIFLRPTPTPLTLHTDATPFINVSGSAGPLADQIINDYRAINVSHVIDFLIYGLVGLVAIGYVVRNIGEWTKRQ